MSRRTRLAGRPSRPRPMLRRWTPSPSTRPLPCPARPIRGHRPIRRRGADGPPFHMTDMIAAEPSLAERICPGTRRRRRRGAAGRGDPRHGPCRLAGRASPAAGPPSTGRSPAAEILREALGPRPASVWSAQALRAVARPADGRVSSSGSRTRAPRGRPTAALERGPGRRRAGPRIITVSDRSPGAALADVVVTTEELDQSWCHTVGYVSPIAAAAAVAGASDRSADRGRRGPGAPRVAG